MIYSGVNGWANAEIKLYIRVRKEKKARKVSLSWTVEILIQGWEILFSCMQCRTTEGGDWRLLHPHLLHFSFISVIAQFQSVCESRVQSQYKHLGFIAQSSDWQ